MDTGNKKQFISDTYLKLLESVPIDKITVKMLISECGLSRQTFYYHFKDIVDVAEYILHGILDDVSEKCIHAKNTKETIRVFLEAIWNNRRLVRKIENSSRFREFQLYVSKEVTDTMHTILDAKNTDLSHLGRDDIQFLLAFFSHGLLGYALERIKNNQEFDVDDLTDRLYRLFVMEMGTDRS